MAIGLITQHNRIAHPGREWISRILSTLKVLSPARQAIGLKTGKMAPQVFLSEVTLDDAARPPGFAAQFSKMFLVDAVGQIVGARQMDAIILARRCKS
jgi:hypothetical protein